MDLVFAIPACCCQNSWIWALFPGILTSQCQPGPLIPFPQAGCYNSIHLVGECGLRGRRLLVKHAEGCFGRFEGKANQTTMQLYIQGFCSSASCFFHIVFSKSFHYAIGAWGIMCYLHAEQNSDPLVLWAARNGERSDARRKQSGQVLRFLWFLRQIFVSFNFQAASFGRWLN